MTHWDTISGPRHELAEEPVWDPPRRRLLWVDVLQREAWSAQLHEDGFGTAQLMWRQDDLISAVRVRPDGTLVHADGTRVIQTAPDGSRATLGGLDLDPARWQVNGLVVLPSGAVLAGTLSRDRSEVGALWRIDHRGASRVVPGVVAGNGLAVDAGRSRVWHVDSLTRALCSYRLTDGDWDDVSTGRTVSRFPGVPGRPDGLDVDPAGNLWIAFWDGGCVRHLDPSGRELDRIGVPAERPTSCAVIAGSQQWLVVTTARTEAEQSGRVLVTHPWT